MRSSILLSEMLHGSGESRLDRCFRAPTELHGRARAVEHAAPELPLSLRRASALDLPAHDSHQQIGELIHARTPSGTYVPSTRIQMSGRWKRDRGRGPVSIDDIT